MNILNVIKMVSQVNIFFVYWHAFIHRIEISEIYIYLNTKFSYKKNN